MRIGDSHVVPEGMDDPRRSAAGELELARTALADGDLQHAAGHVAGALAHAPTLPEAHEVLAQLAARTGGGLDLFPLRQHPFVGTIVARAHLLAAAGRPAEGLELLAIATDHAPAVDWAGVPWVAAPALAEQVDPDRLARLLMRICAGIPDPAPQPGRAALRPYLRLAERAIARHPRAALLLGAASALARRLDEIPLAVHWAGAGVRAAPSKLGEVWLGYAHRSAGRIDAALDALYRAVAYDPDDLSVYADIAGTLADNGRLDEALRWTDRALERDPTFDCAVHTAHRLRYRRDGEVRHLVGLADFQREHPDDSHEHGDLAECCSGEPWLGRLPAAQEAVAGVLRRMLADGHGRDSSGLVARGRVRLSGLEPPSALRAVAAAAPGLRLDIEKVPDPDPRLPRRAVERPLWRYDGTTATPALPPPSAAAAERIRQLARPGWRHPPDAYDSAVALATVELDDLLALLVHPPAPPDDELGRSLLEHDPTLWVRSVQVWACLGLLHHRTDEPWPASTRRRVLLDLLWGVEDWVTEAALFALITYAWVDPSVRPEVARTGTERLADAMAAARTRPVSILNSLAWLLLAAPDVDPTVLVLTRELLGMHRLREPGWLARLWRRLLRR
ncbi:tetratricopeptide repeat protein [Plantactinospora siamensis]|uniref:Tetratricopeptide repeat protein n=1 Tax=Plantactinospora siamensis TaxID=555372 RepID=A0ABV6NX92_9ACTN